MIIPLIISIMLVASVTVPFAFADRFSEWLDVWKKAEEERAIKYQKEVLHFDYSKIQNKDPGFKGPVESKDIPKKHIQNSIKQNFKVIKNLNNHSSE